MFLTFKLITYSIDGFTLGMKSRSVAHLQSESAQIYWILGLELCEVHSGAVYTMDHEVRPWKMAFVNGLS